MENQRTSESGATGRVTILSHPYGIVRVDGERVGTTPMNGQKLPVGEHTIELLDPETEAVRGRRTIRVELDQSIRVIFR